MSSEERALIEAKRRELEAQLAELAKTDAELSLREISANINDTSTDAELEQAVQELIKLPRTDEIQVQLDRIAEIRKTRELTKPITITVSSVTGATVLFSKSAYREDVVRTMKNTPNRSYRGDGSDLIPLAEYQNLCERLKQLPNITLEISDGVQARIDRILNAPKWFIDLHLTAGGQAAMLIQPGPYVSHWVLKDNFSWKHHSGSLDEPTFSIPIAEAWKIPSTFVEVKRTWDKIALVWVEETIPIEGVVYSEAAKSFIEKQLQNRAILDSVATMSDDPEVQRILNDLGWNGELYPFQRVGVRYGMLATGGRFILADQVGLGKTWQALALALVTGAQKVLCVVPASLIPNWVREIKRRTGEDAVVLRGGNPATWAMMLALKPHKFVVTNYETLGKRKDEEVWRKTALGGEVKDTVTTWPVVEFLKLFPFDMIVFDEGHYLKNTGSNRSQAARLFAKECTAKTIMPMTGHPVMNRPEELWPLLTIVAPGEFSSKEKFMLRYSPDGRSVQNAEELHELVKPMFLRRLKKNIFTELPPITRITEYHELSDKTGKAYKRALKGLYTSLAEYDAEGEGGTEMHIMNILAKISRLKQICAADKIDHCAELAIELFDAEDDNNGPRKVLIFTQFKGPAYNIARKLGGEALCFVKKVQHQGKKATFETADIDERDRLIQQFQNDPNIHYMVVTEKATREGHNITAAGSVIFNDLFWTPAAHEQAEGRAYGRIGDMHGISSHWLVTEKGEDNLYEIEEWIMELLANKLSVIEQVVEGIESSRKDISIAKELINKIKSSMWTRAK